MNGISQQSDGWAIPATFVLIWLCPAAAVVLALLLLSVKAPKITGTLVVAATVNGFIHFLTEGGTASDETGFMLIPVVLLFLALIAAGCGLFAWGLRGGLAAATALPRLPNAPLPSPLPIASNASSRPARGSETSAGEPDDQDEEEKMYAAMQEAKAIAGRMQGEHEARKRIFERVFRHRCQQRGVTVSRIVWKRSDHSRVGDEAETGNQH